MSEYKPRIADKMLRESLEAMGGIHERIGLCFQYGDVYVAGQAAPVNEQLDVFGHSASYHEECQQVVCLKSP